eukprot:gnl/TRDRNA2_/TRDRNA2_194200_c0_seq1.p1 gnl/TRDRNA2_/TRDRNA2_194200_c0~~gnl/TRDRNA2_/TRDRNA2_194200_c0_seq1.p1  ORF type:complete len:389 (-),score=80.93 gnl/TRDRNA2_/TRDRNA2_194200_c0_seq1:15-1181(-)
MQGDAPAEASRSSRSRSPCRPLVRGPCKDFRFKGAVDRSFSGLNEAAEGTWQGPFSFVQLADPQIGMFHGNASWEEELDMIRLAVQHVNRLKPRFVLISGDLQNAFPIGPGSDFEAGRRQVADLKEVLREVDDAIPLVVLPGNHDIGQKPTPKEVDDYITHWGDDYFAFWVGGVYFVVINSQYYMDGSETQDRRAEQDRWLEAELQAVAEKSARHVVVLSHVPPFVGEPGEKQGWANWELEPRERILRMAGAANARLWLSGHYHGNVVATSKEGVEVVISSSCGSVINWVERPELVGTSERPNFGKDGHVGNPPLLVDAKHSGLRIVQFLENGHRHRWFSMADVPQTLEEVFAVPQEQANWTRPLDEKVKRKDVNVDEATAGASGLVR